MFTPAGGGTWGGGRGHRASQKTARWGLGALGFPGWQGLWAGIHGGRDPQPSPAPAPRPSQQVPGQAKGTRSSPLGPNRVA